MGSTGRRLNRFALDAMLLGAAMMLSYIEAVLPIALVIPVPGVKLGLANLAVMIAFFDCGIVDAAVISAARVLLCGLLFGSPVSTAMAAGGALFAFAGLIIYRFALERAFSVLGASLISAALHAVGQLVAASIIISDSSVFTYAPVMLISAAGTGAFNGYLCVLILKKLTKSARRSHA